MSDTFMYLIFIALPFFIGAVVIFILRSDLRRFIIKAGVIGGIVGLISEAWYFHDYWRPPSLFGVATPSIEDFLFGFGIVAFAATLPLVIFNEKRAERTAGSRKRGVLLLLSSLGGIVVLASIFHINSVIVSFLVFGGLGLFILIKRPQSTKKALLTGIILAGIALITYSGIHFFSPNYFTAYYLLSAQPIGVTILGLMPVTEFLWYFLWGLAGSVIFEYISGGDNGKPLKLQP